MDPLSPKELQARIRMGATPEELVDEVGWPLEKIQRFAAPLLAERAFIAAAAQDAPVRTEDGETTLGEAVQASCFAARLPVHGLEWDSWRRPDGRWVVSVILPVGVATVRASWAFDPRVKSLHDLDEAARWLLGASDVSLDELVRHQTLTLPLPRMRSRPMDDWEDLRRAESVRVPPQSEPGDEWEFIATAAAGVSALEEEAERPTAIARAAARRLTVVPTPPATVTALPRPEPEPEPTPEPEPEPEPTPEPEPEPEPTPEPTPEPEPRPAPRIVARSPGELPPPR